MDWLDLRRGAYGEPQCTTSANRASDADEMDVTKLQLTVCSILDPAQADREPTFVLVAIFVRRDIDSLLRSLDAFLTHIKKYVSRSWRSEGRELA